MVIKYPIQKRWPYRPRNKYLSIVWWYCINFYDKSADYIRAWFAYARRRFFAK